MRWWKIKIFNGNRQEMVFRATNYSSARQRTQGFPPGYIWTIEELHL